MSTDSAWGVIIGAAIVFWMVSPKPDIEEVTAYFYYCPDFKHNAFDCPTETRTMSMAFQVFIREQRVVSKSSLSAVDLSPCAVYDAENWECRIDNNDTRGMSDGDYYNTMDNHRLDADGKETYLPAYSQIGYIGYLLRSGIEFSRSLGIL